MRGLREPARRLTLGVVLALAAGASVGDIVSAPDARRGSHPVTIELPDDLGTTTMHVPRTPASGVALLLYDHDPLSVAPVIDHLAVSTLLVPLDVSRWRGASAPDCQVLADQFARASRRAQRDAGLTTYHAAVIVGAGSAGPLARRLVQTGDPVLFAAGVGADAPTGRSGGLSCTNASADAAHVGTATRARQTDPRWTTVTAAALPAAARTALDRDVPPPSTGYAPLDRWLAYFQLPLSAAWAQEPRAVVILMSDAPGLRAGDVRLAGALAERHISVLSVDALRYFWQRRSPGDVAFELKRLMGALASLDVPILAGGVGVGASTMAVAAQYEEDAPLAGLVLVDPGPSAYFEVEPPLPALVPLIKADWSTAAAVRRLALPTLCVSEQGGRARVLCDDLAGVPFVTAQHHGRVEDGRMSSLAAIVSTFVSQQPRPARPRIGARPPRPRYAQPRKPRT